MSPAAAQVMDIGGHQVRLTNLDKVIFPADPSDAEPFGRPFAGWVKGNLVEYATRIAPTVLPHLAGRPITRIRFPSGPAGPSFFEKNAPRGTPDWVRVIRVPSPGSSRDREHLDYVTVPDPADGPAAFATGLATLVWLANLAAIEWHTPMWRLDGSALTGSAPGEPVTGRPRVDLMVFDLDPGAPADVVTCCEVALEVRAALAADGLAGWAKTSGSKGLQVYVPITPTEPGRTSEYAKALAQRLVRARPELVVSTMAKVERPGRVLVDWSQNNAAKTTVSVWSLRAKTGRPTVSTPVTWDEVEGCRSPGDLTFLADDALRRLGEHGDAFAPVLAADQALPPKA
jgi:bifunctional non-homologous end joining protein LigD